MTLYLDDIFLNWGDKSERNVESLIMMLFSSYLDYLIPSLSVSLKKVVIRFSDGHIR